jgi:DNA helicase-2/ATP-dependent DNA helicase PcrA
MEKTVILARTNRALRPFEEALTEAGVRYHFIGRSGFFSQIEVRSAVDWLNLVLFPSDWALSGAIRSAFAPSKYLPKSKLTSRLKELRTDEFSYWHLLTAEPHQLVEHKNLPALAEFTQFVAALRRFRGLPTQQAVKEVLQAIKAFDSVAGEEDPDNDAAANLLELVKLSAKHNSLKEFLDYIRRATAAAKGKKGVSLSTCHAAKGLEFHSVYLVQCSEKIMPHSKSTDLAEERNIFFVGTSRAERKLTITFSGAPSQFIAKYVEVPACEQSL